jgi:hypothetical protein
VEAFRPYTAKAQAEELLSFLGKALESWHVNPVR